jgi:4-hydroxy-2-oxoheptanedioate aldolase
MDIPTNRFKRALKAGRRQIGLWSTLSSSYTVEVIAGAGFDWIMIDTEHSPADLESVLGQLQAAAPYDATAVVRLPWNDMVTVKRTLDIGAQTLLVPQVTSAEEAKNAVAYTRYPNAGVRGVAGATRATRFGRVKDYFKKAEGELCVLVQIESAEGLENLEEIAAVEGIDGVFIGPADLHASLGYAGERAHDAVMPRIDDAVSRIVRTGKAAGILADTETTARRWLALGALFVAVGSDVGLLARGADALAAKFRTEEG